MPRTSAAAVKGIIEVDSDIDLTPFIEVANALVEEIATPSGHAAIQLELIERWLSAHFYCMRDPRAERERAGPVGATYQSKVDLNLATSHYGQMAMVLDTSGELAALSGKTKRTVSVTWAGTVSTRDKSK